MTLREAVEVLVLGAGREFPVLDTQGLRVLFASDNAAAFNMGVRRLVDIGLLERVGRGVYLNKGAPPMGRRGPGAVARHLRPNHLSYLSCESALAEFGSISQVPMTFIVATTGRGGEYSTPCGDIAFTHTSRPDAEIVGNTAYDDRIDLRVASPELAYDDLRRVRPSSLHLVDAEIHAEVIDEWRNLAHA